MKIYTSYFANYRSFKDLVPIAISRSVPPGYTGLRFIDLAPSWDILNKYKSTGDEISYKAEYRKQLARISPQQVLNHLNSMSGGRDVVLLCFEKKGAFCHRYTAAEYLEIDGILIEEL